MPVFIALLLQYESFHMVFSSPESMKKRLRNMIKGRKPKVDAVRDALAVIDAKEIEAIQDTVVEKIKRNRVLQGGTIDGYVTAAIDGVELFSSTKKSCFECLSRSGESDTTEYFHRSVVCATIGQSPHIIFGQEMLKPRDGAQKDEGELTGAKRLLERLYAKHGHFADVIVADALYLNAPFIHSILACRMDAVIRLKDERRLLFQDAEGLFSRGHGKKEDFQAQGKTVEVWDISDFEMTNLETKVRVLKFRETYTERGKKAVRHMWVVTTLQSTDHKTIWKMMHRRWDIEDNAFHQLKTYYHAKHCYCHQAVETIFLLTIVAFNLRELYIFRRSHKLKKNDTTLKSITSIFRDHLLLMNYIPILYNDNG